MPILLFALFIFRGFLSFEPVGLPRFWHSIDSFAIILVDYPTRTSIRAEAFTSGI
jgi:hypothetical protein